MKNFLSNIALFLLVLLAATIAIPLLRDPYYGNDLYRKKLQDASSSEGQVNTLFYGSSRFYRHIDPLLADSLLEDHGFSSYNMGATSLLNPQSYVLYEELLRNHDLSLDRVFLEISSFRQIKPGNIPTARNYYYLEPSVLWWIARYMRHDPRPLDVGGRILSEYAASYAYKLLFAVPDAVEGLAEGREPLPDLLRRNRGYYPLDSEYRLATEEDDPVVLRREAFLADSTVVDAYTNASLRDYGEGPRPGPFNPVHLERLRELMALSEEKGVTLYFVISPRMARYDRILALRDSLPADRVLDLGSAERYPAFYRTAYTFDANHLNAEGARVFTRELAAKIRELLGDGSAGENGR